MILFLLVTSIANIALGYALAVYLGGASATSRESTPSASTNDDLVPIEMKAEALPSLTAGFPNAEIAESQESGAPDDVTVATPNEPPLPAAEEIEHELLAGIADFRNQLAQLRGQADSGPVLEQLASGASS